MAEQTITLQQFQELQNRVVVLERRPTIDRYLDNQSKDVLKQVMSDRIIDIVWNKYIYLMSDFAADGWSVVSNAGSPVTGSGLTLQTTAVINNRSNAYRKMKFQQVMSFDYESRFRTLFLLGVDTTAASIDYSMTVGSGIPTPLSNNYGFRLEGNILYGLCCNGVSESKIAILTTNASQGGGIETFPYLIEARYIPGQRVDFFISDTSGVSIAANKSLTTNLPSGTNDQGIAFDIYTRSANSKQAFIDFIEYIQVKPIR